MPLLTREEYSNLLKQLETYDDIHRLHESTGLSRDLLLVIYTHRVTRDATRRYYTVLNHVREMVSEWHHGRSYTEIARKWRFPPVLIAQMIEKQKQTPRGVFWDGFRRPEEIRDARIRAEVQEAVAADWIYSPRGGEIQRERGVLGEKRLHDWLEKYGVPYRTEKELRGQYSKTPDALLGRPIGLNGQRINWIESKANFGDDVEVGRNLRKQLEPYVNLFGGGVVVYWFGYVRGTKNSDQIQVMDGEEFEAMVPTEPPEGENAPPAAPSAPAPAPESREIPRSVTNMPPPSRRRGGEWRERREPRRPEGGEPMRPSGPSVSPTPPHQRRRKLADRSAYF